MTKEEKERDLYDSLVALFPPPPYLLQHEIRPWLFQEIKRASNPHSATKNYGWYIIQMIRFKWEST